MVVSSRNLNHDEKAQVGIGTMIVFIATVLVAAIAAGVLITTSNELQAKSQQTGQEATEQVASNLAVVSMVGKRDSTASTSIDDLELYLTLSPGASDVDLSQARIFMSDGTNQYVLSYAAATSGTEFAATDQRDADNSFSAASPVISSGDLIRVDIDVASVGITATPRANLELRLVPEVGESVFKSIRLPNSYAQDLVIAL